MTDTDPLTDPSTTVQDRMRAAGYSQEKIDRYLTAGLVRVSGEQASGPDHPCPRPTSWAIARSA